MLDALDSGARTTAMLFIILIGAITFGRFVALTRIPYDLTAYIASLNLSPYVVIGIIIVAIVSLGCFIEGISLMVLTMPFLYPLVTKMGFDGVWFGVLFALLLNIGLCTPPVGMSVYILAGVAKDVPLMTMIQGRDPVLDSDSARRVFSGNLPGYSSLACQLHESMTFRAAGFGLGRTKLMD